MQESAFYNIIVNISLLVTVATILVSTPFFQKILLHPGTLRLREKIALGIIFGVFCIMSNLMGIQVEGALLNARVIGALAAGLLGGQVSGILAALIGVCHRYIIDPYGLTTFACCLSTMIQGIGGAVIWKIYYQKNRRYSGPFLFAVTAGFESVHMALTLFLSGPIEEMAEIVRIISVPMITLNAAGMVILFQVFTSVYKMQDKNMAQKLFLTFRIAERSLSYLRKIEKEPENFQKIVDILMEENGECVGAAILNLEQYYGKSQMFASIDWGTDYPPEIVKKVLDQDMAQSWDQAGYKDPFEPLYHRNVVVGAPLKLGGKTIACLVMVVRKRDFSSEADISFVEGLATLCSTQMSLAQLEEQKKLRRKAELQALQSQINPHFLFNALNTISCFCREKPERARELLLALSTYFRNSLKNTDYMVTLKEEIQHIGAYLELEKARFEQQLQVEFQIEAEAEKVMVPNLILQPLVENAVKHGAMKQQAGVVKLTAECQGDIIVIRVRDNGNGIPAEVCEGLKQRRNVSEGIGLWNVNERLLSIYPEQEGLKIETGDWGSEVSMKIPVSGKGWENINEDSYRR